MEYYADIVFCVDGSESMMPLMDKVKQSIYAFPYKVKVAEERWGRDFHFRARIIVFRDYLEDGNRAMQATNFFELPHQDGQFQYAVNAITAEGGGIAASQDGLEAVAYAIKATPWIQVPEIRRRWIVVFSNNPAHPLGYGAQSPYYPKGMAKDFEELTSWWMSASMTGKTMLIFAPDAPGWKEISDNWNYVWHVLEEIGTEKWDNAFDTLIGLDYFGL